MANVSSPAMAAAVSKAGALGSLGVGATDAEGARKMIAELRTLTDHPFNVNLFCHAPAKPNAAVEAAWLARLSPDFEAYDAKSPTKIAQSYRAFLDDDAMLTMLIEVKPAVVSFHFGLPSAEKIELLQNAGIFLMATATCLNEARVIASAGIDAIVAQGFEAGGHRGMFDPDAHDDQLGTMALTRLLARDFDLPIIAAGGMMDGSGIAAALALGAGAAQLGTAFIGCHESLADVGYRNALFSDAAHHTEMTRAISGRPARCLANRFTALGEKIASSEIPSYPIAYDAGKALNSAAKAKGEFGYGAHWSGQGAPLARVLPAGDLVLTLEDEMNRALGSTRAKG